MKSSYIAKEYTLIAAKEYKALILPWTSYFINFQYSWWLAKPFRSQSSKYKKFILEYLSLCYGTDNK